MISWTSWSMPPMSRACFMISETEAGKSRSSRTSSQSLGSARGSIGRHSTPIPGARATADSLGQEISNTGSNALRVLHQKEVAETGEVGIARLRQRLVRGEELLKGRDSREVLKHAAVEEG